ncbi:hypothetical protein [Methylobacterium gregans]|uniref:hypothetical protein n=1 Tax=Methylobacterium gregans TaxID=374424 RepID=UPI003615B67D
MEPADRGAARSFQQAQNMEPTGTLTTKLLASIGMPRWQLGEFMAGMTTSASVPGDPNPQTTGTVSPSRGSGAPAQAAGDGASARPQSFTDERIGAGQGGAGTR